MYHIEAFSRPVSRTQEIASLLKKRLRTDNPLKQWLAVLLIGKVSDS